MPRDTTKAPARPARPHLEAPPHPRVARERRAEELRDKGGRRTPDEAVELLDLLAARVDALEQRLDGRG